MEGDIEGTRKLIDELDEHTYYKCYSRLMVPSVNDDFLLLDESARYMDSCELHLLWALSEYSRGDKNSALDHLSIALELARKVAISHPNYLKAQLPEKPSLTPAELNVLRLLEAGHSNAQIAR